MGLPRLDVHLQSTTIEVEQSDTFRKWESRLKDRRARIIIAARIARLAEGLPGDVAPVGEGVSELKIHDGPRYRVYFKQRGHVLILLLCGGNKKTQSPDIVTAKQIAKEWSAQMTEKFTKYDPASVLESDEDIAIFMADALETGDCGYIAKALGIVARAKGMAQIAEETGLSREQLYRSSSSIGHLVNEAIPRSKRLWRF